MRFTCTLHAIFGYHDEIASRSTAGRFSMEISSICYNCIKGYNNMDKTNIKRVFCLIIWSSKGQI